MESALEVIRSCSSSSSSSRLRVRTTPMVLVADADSRLGKRKKKSEFFTSYPPPPKKRKVYPTNTQCRIPVHATALILVHPTNNAPLVNFLHELRCRNFVAKAPTGHASLRRTCKKRACNAYKFRLSFHFCMPPLVAGQVRPPPVGRAAAVAAPAAAAPQAGVGAVPGILQVEGHRQPAGEEEEGGGGGGEEEEGRRRRRGHPTLCHHVSR